MKKHRSHESSFTKESALHDQTDAPAHSESGRKNLEAEQKKVVDPEAQPKERKQHHKKERVRKEKPEKEQPPIKDIEAKEEKRTEIVEKSLALKKHFEDTPIPKDPHLVARLVVAEHIVALHEQIENPKSRESSLSPNELTAALDYMGELANKLEDPSSEVEPDIQTAYEALLEQTEKALSTEASEEVIEQAGSKTIIEQASQELSSVARAGLREKPQQAEEAKSRHESPLAAVIVTAILTQLHHYSPPHDSGADAPTTSPRTSLLHHGGEGYSSSASSRETTRSGVSPTIPSPAHLTHLSPAEARSQYLDAVAREHRMSRPFISGAAPIAAVAITSALRSPSAERPPLSSSVISIPQEQSSSRLQEYSPFTSPPVSENSSPAAAPLSFEANSFKTTATNREASSFTPSQPLESVSRTSKKLEHLPLQTLLTMADGVAIGHGRYLRKEFEQNQIDKEGLIKVLKARAKGQDYAMEYRHQTKRFRLAKTSPEFLHTSQSQDTGTSVKSAPHQEPTEHGPEEPVKPPKVPRPFMSVNETVAPLMTPRPETTKNSSLKWIGIVLVACTIVAVILVAIFLL